jgi:F0F1-type ATP synthase epsilon subunit
MNASLLRFMVRTPREIVLELEVSSIRVPTETGQVGIRPRVEPLVLAVEPGVVLIRRGSDYEFAGTAGGLLRCNGAIASLLTPLAVAGDNEDAVIKAIEDTLAQPSVEMEARAMLGRLQTSILRELELTRTERVRRIEATS